MNANPTNVLVVAAHPDDEVLGCGGVIARHAAAGDAVHILILAEGATSRGAAGSEADDEVAALQAAARRSAEILGAAPPAFAGLPDNRMDDLALLDVVKIVERTVRETGAAVVYTHHGGDLNVDHRICHQAVLTACRPLPGAPVRAVYAFETVSSTEWEQGGGTFRPTRFVDISDHLAAKRRALEAYASEMRPFPHARSIEAVDALARVRGAASGVSAAEAFMVVREVIGR